jgi:hypothetical protein
MKIQGKINAYDKPTLIIKSHVKDWINSKGYRMRDLTTRAVNDAVIEVLEKSLIRAKLSKRRTVCPKDI